MLYIGSKAIGFDVAADMSLPVDTTPSLYDISAPASPSTLKSSCYSGILMY